MKEMVINENFADVTLVTDDKKHIKAHKNILSSCSQVFKDILQEEKGSVSTIFLRGIHSSEIQLLLQYIYLGKVTLEEKK